MKHSIFAKNPKCDWHQCNLASMLFITLFNKKCSGGTIKNQNKSNKELAEELDNQLLEKVRKKRLTHFL